MLKQLAVLIVAVGAVASAQAGDFRDGNKFMDWSHPTAAPEIDPASAMSAFTLLTGGLVMLRGRRAKK